MEEITKIIVLSLVSIVVLFILAKLMGYKQMSQLSMFDYVNGITIGSIAAELSTAIDDNYIEPLLAMIIYGIIAYLFSFATEKSVKMRRFLTGRAIVLIDDGKIYEDNLSKSRLDIDDLLAELRNNGFFNPSDIQIAIMETNGKISILPKSTVRPLNPADVNITPVQQKTPSNVILDGNIMKDNLKFTGNNETWLKKQLHSQGITDIKNIFLATCDDKNNLSVFIKVSGDKKKNIFS